MPSCDYTLLSSDLIKSDILLYPYKKSSPSNTKAKCTLVALAIVSFIGATLLGLCIASLFGPIGSIGFIAAVAGGSILVLSSLFGIVYYGCKSKKTQPKEVKKTPIKIKKPQTTQQPNEKPNPPPVTHKQTQTQSSEDTSTIEQDSEFEKLEKTFWEMHYRGNTFHSLLEMAKNSTDDSLTRAEFLVDHYLTYMRRNEPAFSCSEDDKKKLIKKVAHQLASRESLAPVASSVKSLSDNQELVIYPTVGDGTCGLHALLGIVDKYGMFSTDAKEKRKEFCEWLNRKFQEDNLPPQIKNVLEDYFLYFELAPEGFKKAAKAQFVKHHENYDALSQELQDQRKTAFIRDKQVFQAYLDNLKKTGVYLLQVELEVAAICFDKQIVLYQPTWSDSIENKVEYDTLNPEGSDIVHIWYNGYNHYERAEVRSKSMS